RDPRGTTRTHDGCATRRREIGASAIRRPDRSARRRSPARDSCRSDRRAGGVMLRVNVITIFPEFFTGPLGLSILNRARDAGSVEYRVINLRDFTHDKHRTVDDAPYGGGAGMVMKPEPFFEAVDSLATKPPVVLLSPRG